MDRVVTLKPCLALQLKSLLAILKILFNVEEVLGGFLVPSLHVNAGAVVLVVTQLSRMFVDLVGS